MYPVEHHLYEALSRRKNDDSLRVLPAGRDLIDFCSNDYLGYARDKDLWRSVVSEISAQAHKNISGSSGSRLLGGNSMYAEDLEQYIASFHGAESALLYNSGYDANTGFFSCVPQKGDTVIYDELIHASVRDGMRLGAAQSFPFFHNDIAHLEKRLRSGSGNVFIAVESVYSMDGDYAPLKKIAAIARKYKSHLFVDEAHATGLMGPGGAGMVQSLGLEDKVFARVHTFGKALGTHGAAILGSPVLKKYLLNFSRQFIYTTALPLHNLAGIRCAYEKLRKEYSRYGRINELVSMFRKESGSLPGMHLPDSGSPIQSVILKGNTYVRSVAKRVQKRGYDVRAVLSPTVAKGKERLRIIIHLFNTETEIKGLVKAIGESL